MRELDHHFDRYLPKRVERYASAGDVSEDLVDKPVYEYVVRATCQKYSHPTHSIEELHKFQSENCNGPNCTEEIILE